ncbi:prolyl oligopeptidase family serine peptidase [Streptomyces albus]|uniref:prolyl oligopeptidase family serine peptidase n=1 Tax=Streptomyces sp. PHES57 TaxID=2872626 RepID=UPI001CEDD353|nr:prolyl oligopeptidase family serine peptidase [Streptomyces sp. PHES57]
MEDDPYLWLEEIEGENALAWVEERNAETVAELTADPGFAALRREVREVLDDTARIPYVTRRGPHLYNFWRDATHVRGVWRRTTLDEYRRAEPRWDTVVDVDALARQEDVPWVWAGASVLRPGWRRALVKLSRDGADATVVREFDMETRTFVPGGFRLPEAKTSVSWIDEDHILVGTDTGPGSLTASGYPRTVRCWRRGTPLEAAPVVFEGRHEDVSVAAWHDPSPGFERRLAVRHQDFWHSERFVLYEDADPVRIEVPDDAVATVHREWLLVSLRSPWLGRPAGALLAFGFDAFLRGGREHEVLFVPDERTVLEGYATTRGHLVLETLTDVSSRLHVLTPHEGGSWSRSPLGEVPELSTAAVRATAWEGEEGETAEEVLFSVSGFLQPATLCRTVAGVEGVETLKHAPALFSAEGLGVRQHFAVSSDGTRVPYFVVGPERQEGPAPTLLYGYGGFEVSLTPSHSSVTGRAWLERGGTYVVANIRGGGEYGPDWHRAALGAHRDLAFDDFAAVAKDLVARGITTAGRLGIMGGSNGGLLMGVMLTRHPELFGAVVAEVPLLDMLRYHRLLAGASWTAEYGDPDDPGAREHLLRWSPYHNLDPARGCPPVLLTTSTRDDRVHPGHARKMAALLREKGLPVRYFENTGGGHSGASDHEQASFVEAVVHTFLWRTLTAEGRVPEKVRAADRTPSSEGSGRRLGRAVG